MDIITILDLTNIILIVLGFITIVTTGLLSKKIRLNKSIIISVIGIFILSFLVSNMLTTIEQMRYVVLSLFLFVLFPWIIAYIITWTISHEKTTKGRIKFSMFVGWWLGLLLITILRLFLGWGFESVISIILIGLLLSFFNGIFGGILGSYLITKIEKINPTQ